MCSPALAAVGMAGGSGLQAGSGYSSGMTSSKLADQNAVLTERSAKDELVADKEDGAAMRREGARILGHQVASYASAGVESGYGSALEVQRETKRDVELARTVNRNNARRRAWGLRVRAAGLRVESDAARSGAKGALFGGLLSGAAQSYSAGKTGGAWGSSGAEEP